MAKIRQLPAPSPVGVAVDAIGHVHLESITDPIIGPTINQLRTLDITRNPGLSIKDVMAWSMLKSALDSGEATRDTWIVEGTSGNTGAGLAIVAVHIGMRCLLIIPDKMSQEKIDRLKNLGAHVIVTPTKVDADDPKSYYLVRDYCTKQLGGWRANQYDNLASPSPSRNYWT